MQRKTMKIMTLAVSSTLLLMTGSLPAVASSSIVFSPKVISTAPSTGNSPEWVKWNSSSCSFVSFKGSHAKIWQAATRKSVKGFSVGFGAQDQTNEVNITMNTSMASAARAAGVTLASANYEFPSTSTPISAARSIVARNPSVVVSNNQVDTLLVSVNAIYKKACLPVVQVVTASAGTVLFGPSNPGMGLLEGKRLVDVANARGWTTANTTLMTTYFSPAGPEVAKRASECARIVKAAFPGIQSVSHDTTSTTALELQGKFTDLLTANPKAQNILVCTIADLWALADANALKLAGRTATSAVTGVNGGKAVLDAMAQGDSAMVGTVDLGAATWGKYWIPMAEDIASGKPVPAVVYSPIKMLPVATPK